MTKTTHAQYTKWTMAFKAALPLLALGAASAAWSQALPAAGQQPSGVPQREVAPVQVAPLAAPQAVVGTTVANINVTGFVFSGNNTVTSRELQAVVADSVNQTVDLAGLDAIANRVSRYYRAKGYTVARAYLPPQQSTDGVIRIAVVEGLYDKVNLKNSSQVSDARVQAMMAANLCADGNGVDCKGKLILDNGLERAVLLVKDLPGTTAVASVRPGSIVGTSDLQVEAKTTRPRGYSIGLDNYGGKATGEYRLNANAEFNNPNNNGDQLSLGAVVAGKSNSGNVAYSFPVGYGGGRMGVALARGQYRLGAGYEATQSHGTSNTVSAFGSYPVLRTVNQNFYVRGVLEARKMYDSVDVTNRSFAKSASVLRVGFNGDNVDNFGGGGYTLYGMMASVGHLGTNDSSDATGAQTAGGFSKVSYNLGRQQALSGPFTLYGGVYGQQAGKRNLDGSEQIGIGGPTAVRAYAGEGGGSSGAVANLELRYTTPVGLGSLGNSNMTTAFFLDRGWVDIYANATTATPAATRALGGYGVAIGLQSPTHYLRAVVAAHGNKSDQLSQVDANSFKKFWFQAGLNF